MYAESWASLAVDRYRIFLPPQVNPLRPKHGPDSNADRLTHASRPGRLVRFELSEQTRQAIDDYLTADISSILTVG
jgi:hypothetical protein